MSHIVIVGAGQAGAALAAKLRGLEFTGQITLIGEERVPPYQRPPLSKKYLLGEMELERLFLRPPDFYAENGIDLRLSDTAIAIDRVKWYRAATTYIDACDTMGTGPAARAGH